MLGLKPSNKLLIEVPINMAKRTLQGSLTSTWHILSPSLNSPV